MQLDSICKDNPKRGRGRPRTKPPQPSVFSINFSFDYAENLSKMITKKMGIPNSALTYNLAHITLAYGPIRELQKRGLTRKGSTRRTRIHLAVLLRDVAKMYAEFTGSDAQVELRKINGYREERRRDELAKNLDERPAVEILARIVMAMWGDETKESLQRPARAAIKLF
jgi:hypothetical protein